MSAELKIVTRIANELGVQVAQVAATVELLAEGATVPFIARYRKEKTGGLDDTQLRKLDERLGYLRELEDRRATVLKSIDEQGKLTPDLARAIGGAETKVDLEDLYAPFKPKRRTKAQIAREAGLEPLADALLANPTLSPEAEAAKFVSSEKGVADAKAALDGARHILIERIGETPQLVGNLRDWLWETGLSTCKVVKGKEAEGAKFADYFDFSQKMKELPSHRILAMLRGRNEGFLDLELDVPKVDKQPHPADGRIMAAFGIADRGRPADKWLADTVRLAWKAKLHVSLSGDLMTRLKERADAEAISVFSKNLKDLLLAAPAGPRATMGLDPGIRTGVKVAVVDATGKVVATDTVYPHEPRRDWHGAMATIAALCMRHKVELIAIGNGTASRETDKLVAEVMQKMPELKLTKVMVSEAGASVYSASELAANEFPDLDVSLRGAVSIARRLQDPLAELVKIEPKAIGVGQYQHDVDQNGLARSLDAVVEDCVNAVGVDVNTASAPLLARVAGLNATHQQQHRRLPRRERRIQDPLRHQEGAAARAEGVRAGGGLPAHHERSQSARRLGGASGSLQPGREDRRGDKAAAEVDDRRPHVPEVATAAGNSPTTSSVCRRSPTSWPSWRSPVAIRGPSSRPRPSRTASRRSRT